jgi:hypothetical protein
MLWSDDGKGHHTNPGDLQRDRMGQRQVIQYEWKCACDIVIKADSEKQMKEAKRKHYNNHAKESGWEEQK